MNHMGHALCAAHPSNELWTWGMVLAMEAEKIRLVDGLTPLVSPNCIPPQRIFTGAHANA